MAERRPCAGEKYRHFKNKLYQIIGIAVHSETREELVVYQALYGDFSMYVRPLPMFVNEVDHVKYPEVKQKYRFERIRILADGSIASDEEETEESKSDTKAMPTFESESVKSEEAKAGPAVTEKALPDASESPEVEPLLMRFLDARDLEERYRILSDMREIVDDSMIDSMAVVCDMVIEDGDLMTRYDALRQAIATKQKYEQANRLR